MSRTFQMGLGTRIAATMLLALILVQGVNAATFFFLPRPATTIYSARWLIAELKDEARTIFLTPSKGRPDVSAQLSQKLKLDVRWTQDLPPQEPSRHSVPGFLRRLESTLRVALPDVKQVRVEPRGPERDIWDSKHRFVPDGFEDELPVGPMDTNEPDMPIVGAFQIAIQGEDGSWITVGTPRPEFRSVLNPMVITAASALVLIAVLSVWTARRSLRPIDELEAAARRIGIEREPRPIDTRALGDFAVIGVAMNDMQQRINGFINERTQMLAAISHDLRTGLTRLRLNVEEMPESPIKDRILKNTEDMEQMLLATLTFAGDDLKAERSERVDLASLLITICDGFSDAGASVDYRGPDHLFSVCQRIALRRAFANVIENAIKYGGSAQVELRTQTDGIFVAVRDQGPGIPPEHVEEAFRPFNRLERSRSRETGGVGLGLSIVRDIVAAHGGSITLRNHPRGGLEAVFHFPLTSSLAA